VRRASDLPRRGARRISGRVVLIALGVLFLLVVVFGRALARFYVDYLWHEGLGRSDVFWGVIRAKVTLFVLFFAAFAILAGVNLFVADRLSPTRFPANVHPYVERFHELFGHRLRLFRYLGAGLLAVLVALPTTSQWQSWLLFRNSQSFGISDPQFHADVGFYVFELPFVSFVLDWLFIAMVLVLVMTVLTHVLNGGVVFASPMPSVRPATKGHIAVLLAVLATLKAADYWVTRYETTNERRGFVQGATYAVVNAQLPALMLLMLVALVTAALYLATLRRASWRIPLIASGLWLVLLVVGGYLYPALVQSLVVNPNQQSRELPFIERNVEATRNAMGINTVTPIEVELEPLDATAVAADPAPLQDVRLLNPGEMLTRFQIDEGDQAGLLIDDLDVDRYEIDGRTQQILIAARELDLDGSPNQSWQGRHLINTRGCGLVMAPASRVLESDRPQYMVPEGITRPELYFSPTLSGYAVARTSENERECPGGETEDYVGTAGVEMSSFVRRAAFALAFLDYNVLGSGAIEDDSQMLWVRNVRDRLTKLAPFLSYDGDPYPVIVNGRVKWVVDAYTTTSRYPYAQRIGNEVQLTSNNGLDRDANYVRNSVKAVVDAYDGTVMFYVHDDKDPIVKAWESAFGDLFTPGSEMPDVLREHLRYPEDLFRVQTDVYSKYQLEPDRFFERQGAWSVAQAPSVNPRGESAAPTPVTDNNDVQQPTELASESSTSRFVPYYTMFRDPAGEGTEFVLLRPYVPFSRDDRRTELQAYMTASSDPEHYGRLTAYVLPELPEGPRTVANVIDSEPTIATRITQQVGGGNEVRFGDLQLVPVGRGLLWVRPFYAQVPPNAEQGAEGVTEYRFVTVAYNNRAAIGESLGAALAELFQGFEGDLGDRVGGAVPGPDQPTAPEEPETATPEDALAQADELLKEAQEALDANDLGTYQEKVDEAATLIDEALATLAPATRQPAGEPGDADTGSETETEATAPSTAPLETVPVDGG
jgi:uncharacterized membrane protein (UPF0182 family)